MFLFKRMYLEPEVKWPTSVGSSKKQESSSKTSTSAVLTTPKPLTMWITTNCGKFFKRWEYQTTWPASWEICMHQARMLEWVADSFARGSSWPGDWTWVSSLVGRFFTTEPPGKYFSDLMEICVEVWASAARSVDKIKRHDLWWEFVTHLIFIIRKKVAL